MVPLWALGEACLLSGLSLPLGTRLSIAAWAPQAAATPGAPGGRARRPPERREDALLPPFHPPPGLPFPSARLYLRPFGSPSGISAPQEQGVCSVYCPASACWKRAYAHWLVLNHVVSSGHFLGEWCFSLHRGHPSSVPRGLPSCLPCQRRQWSVCDVHGVGYAVFRACSMRLHGDAWLPVENHASL